MSATRRVRRVIPHIPEDQIQEILASIERSLRSGMLTAGPLNAEFEAEFARRVGVRHAIAVNSGTAALEIALECIDIREREVIVPTETFVASANSVIRAGGRPVFAEIHPDTLCLDIDDVERRINPKTAAVMLVHMAGLITPELDRLVQLCERHGLALVEDAAHAHGAAIGGRAAGSLGRAGCFSFFPTKVITSAEGGMITTDDDVLATQARSLRNHGANPNGSDYVAVSTNWRLTEPCAAIGVAQLKRLDQVLERRNQIAAQYNRGLAELPGIRPLPTYPDIYHSYWNYLVLLEEGVDRVALASALRDDYGVDVAWPYDPPCHLQPVFQQRLGTRRGDLPQSERLLARHLSLPMHMLLTDEDVEYVIESLRKLLAGSNR